MQQQMGMALDEAGKQCQAGQCDHVRAGGDVDVIGRPGLRDPLAANQHGPPRMQLVAVEHRVRSQHDGRLSVDHLEHVLGAHSHTGAAAQAAAEVDDRTMQMHRLAPQPRPALLNDERLLAW